MSQATKINMFTTYKRVNKKIKSVFIVFFKDVKVKRQFLEDLLDSLSNLSFHLLVFIFT